MENIKAVIFDLDNTLLDRVRTFRHFAASLAAAYFRHIEDREPIISRIIELDQDGYKDKRHLFAELIEELPWLAIPDVTELMSYYQIHYVNHASLMEGATETVRYMREKYQVGIITNGQTIIQYGKIDRLGIRELFDLILVSEEAGVKKPNVKIFEMASEQLHVHPAQCVYIGDHPVNDMEGAGKAGMKTIWIEVNQPWREEVTIRPDYTIKQLNELEAIL